MKRDVLFSLLILAFGLSFSTAYAQGVYLDPPDFDVNAPGTRLYVDISSPECDCDVLSDVGAENPLYLWTWQPAENRPMLSGSIDVANGQWNNSNDNLLMQQDPDNPNLWYYDFLGASIVDWYGVSQEEAEAAGLAFLVKEKNGTGNPEPKSPDLFLPLVVQQSSPGGAGFDLELELFATGFTRPCDIVHSGLEDDERMFVVEQNGFIRILNEDGSIESTPFLNIQSTVNSNGNEQGLLGLAFSPDYAEDGYFYVNYTNQSSTVVARYEVSSDDPNVADAGSGEVLLSFIQDFGNHNGGQIEFGPDGYLYIASGDGGSGGDPNNRAQDLQSMLGKMLRIDVSTVPYSIPPDNPFVGDENALDEIWSYGLRNPWKCAFDEFTGDFYMADVGQSTREEVNYEPVGFEGGANYGWRCYEGTFTFNMSDDCPNIDHREPIMDYAWGNQGNGFRCSITGGRVYRGSEYGNLHGKYFAVDYCSGEYWVLWQEDGEWQEFLSSNTLTSNIVAFGANKDLELFAVRGGSNGQIYRVKENCSLLSTELTFSDNTLLASLDNGVEYQWYLNGELLTSTDTPELEVSEDGDYQVLVITSNECQIASDVLEVIVLSSSSFNAKQGLRIFPNPAHSELRIQVEGRFQGAQQVRLSIFTLEGRLVGQEILAEHSGNDWTVPVASLPQGFYLLHLESGDERINASFVKK